MTNNVLYHSFIVKNDDIENIKSITSSSSYQSYDNGNHKHVERYSWIDNSNNKGEYILNEPNTSIDRKFFVKKCVTVDNETYRIYNDIHGFSKLIFWMEKMYRINKNIQCYDAKDNPVIFNNKEDLDYTPNYEYNFSRINLISDTGIYITRENDSMILVPGERGGFHHTFIDTEYGSIYDILDSNGKLLFYFVSVDEKKLNELKEQRKKERIEKPIEEIFENFESTNKTNSIDFITKNEMTEDFSASIGNVLRRYISFVKSQENVDTILDYSFDYINNVIEIIYKDKEENESSKIIDEIVSDTSTKNDIEVIGEDIAKEIDEKETIKDENEETDDDEKTAMIGEIIEQLRPIIMNYILSMEDKKKKKKKKVQN